ncbi:MAG TPA: segregation/condensation protein A [Symbiobacteriaceae bacterium]|nr:segregation/condensation protein A [Symbiobacteriaceae bacterium]
MSKQEMPLQRTESYTVRLEVFEGPLDLLLHLIRREEMNIYDIPIARITEQYLEIIRDLSALDIDRASEFLVMAATLLGIKSRMLLPKPPKLEAEEIPLEEGADPREELVRQLVAYSQYKEAAQELRQREEVMAKVYTRQLFLEQPEGPAPLTGLTLDDLVKAFEEVLKEEWTWREVPREEIPLREKIREINFRISRSPHGVRFRDLFSRGGTRLEIVVTFLALLELMRQRRAIAIQDGIFGEILIRRVLVSDTVKGDPEDDDEPEE